MVALALVILLLNKVAVRWGAASPANNFFSSSSLCVLPLFLLLFFSFLSCLSLFDFSLFSRPLLCFSALKIFYFSFLFFYFLFLFSVLLSLPYSSLFSCFSSLSKTFLFFYPPLFFCSLNLLSKSLSLSTILCFSSGFFHPFVISSKIFPPLTSFSPPLFIRAGER